MAHAEVAGTAPITELTALERHPDGVRLRLTRTRYEGGVFYGPALAGAVPGSLPIRRLHVGTKPDPAGQPRRQAIWFLDSDGRGGGWQRPDELSAEVQPWVREALAPDPETRPHWQRRGGWSALLSWLDAELSEQELERTELPQALKDWGVSCLLRVRTTAGTLYLKALPNFFRTEALVTCVLWRELPGSVAPVLAADTERGLLLLTDAGAPLTEGCSGWFTPPSDAQDWTSEDSASLLAHLASLQRRAETLPLLDHLPDHGPEWVREHLDELLAGPLFLVGQQPDAPVP